MCASTSDGALGSVADHIGNVLHNVVNRRCSMILGARLQTDALDVSYRKATFSRDNISL
jgi:hypothetical protein